MSDPSSPAKSAPKVGIYIRISKDREEQLSTEIQEERCRNYVEGRGWRLHHTYIDKGRSAYRRKLKNGRRTSAPVERPQLDAMMADVRSGVIDAVVVYRLDRLARSVADFAGMWGQLEDAKCEFVSVSEQFDTSTAIGRAMLQISQVFAELESGIKSERIKDWHAKRNADRRFPVGQVPFGYNSDHTINPDQAQVIRDCAIRVLDGEGVYAIAKSLTEAGVQTARGAAKWEPFSVSRMLVRPTIAGLIEMEGGYVEGKWEPILERDTWDGVRRILLDPKRATGRSTKIKYLLSGIATCGKCGSPMKSTRRHRDGKLRYTCGPRAGWTSCGSLSIDGETLDDYVTNAIAQFLRNSKFPEVETGVDPESHMLRIDGLQTELDDLALLYGDGELTVSEWKQASEGIRRRLREAELASPERSDLTATADIIANFTDGPIEQRRQIIGWLLENVRVLPANMKGPRNRVTTDRIQLEFRPI